MSNTGGSNRSHGGSKPSKDFDKSATAMIQLPTDFQDFLKLLNHLTPASTRGRIVIHRLSEIDSAQPLKSVSLSSTYGVRSF